jgi:hypothetical protein
MHVLPHTLPIVQTRQQVLLLGGLAIGDGGGVGGAMAQALQVTV